SRPRRTRRSWCSASTTSSQRGPAEARAAQADPRAGKAAKAEATAKISEVPPTRGPQEVPNGRGTVPRPGYRTAEFARSTPPSDRRAPESAGHRVLVRPSPRPSIRDRRQTRVRVDPTEESIERTRSEEHTSELQSRENLVCRLLLE